MKPGSLLLYNICLAHDAFRVRRLLAAALTSESVMWARREAPLPKRIDKPQSGLEIRLLNRKGKGKARSMYTFSGRVRFSETDPNGDLKMESLIDYFQDCSTFQSEDLGVGVEYLQKDHLAWLVNYWQIDILQLPHLGDSIVAGTSPYEIRGFMGLRNFMLETGDGKRLVNANSVWSLIDMDRGLPVRASERIVRAYELFPKFDMEYLPRKIRVPKEGGEEKEPIRITEEFLDSNHHVNNGQYVRLAMAYGTESAQIARLRVEYKKQAYLGDVIHPRVYQTEENVILIALNSAAGETYAAVEITKGRK